MAQGRAGARGGCWRWCSSSPPRRRRCSASTPRSSCSRPVVFATAARLRVPAAAARLRLLAPGEQRVAAAADLEPHEPAGVRGERAVVPALRGADGAAVARRARRSSGSCWAARSPATCARAGRAGRARREATVALPRFAHRRRRARRSSASRSVRWPGSRRCGSRRRGRSRSSSASAGRRARVVRATEPPFLVFVLGLAIVVRGGGRPRPAVGGRRPLPHGDGLPALLAIAAIAAVAANLLNNLPATLIVLPPSRPPAAPGPVLAMLIGVNVGPNLTYVGSLATLLWRRVLHAHDHDTDLGEFVQPRRADRPADPARLDARAVVGSAGRVMRVVVWITEAGWEACVETAAALAPADAEITLLAVPVGRARGGRTRAGAPACSGAARRRRRTDAGARSPTRPPRRCSPTRSSASAATRRPRCATGGSSARSSPRARAPTCSSAPATATTSGSAPRASASHARFVVDHAPCRVLLVWPDGPPGLHELPPPPPHEREGHVPPHEREGHVPPHEREGGEHPPPPPPPHER